MNNGTWFIPVLQITKLDRTLDGDFLRQRSAGTGRSRILVTWARWVNKRGCVMAFLTEVLSRQSTVLGANRAERRKGSPGYGGTTQSAPNLLWSWKVILQCPGRLAAESWFQTPEALKTNAPFPAGEEHESAGGCESPGLAWDPPEQGGHLLEELSVSTWLTVDSSKLWLHLQKLKSCLCDLWTHQNPTKDSQ